MEQRGVRMSPETNNTAVSNRRPAKILKETDQSAIPYASGLHPIPSSRRISLKEDRRSIFGNCFDPRKGMRGPGTPVTDQIFLGRVPECPGTKCTVTYWSGAAEVYAVTACHSFNTPSKPLVEGQPIVGEDISDLRLVTPAVYSVSTKGVIIDGNELYHC